MTEGYTPTDRAYLESAILNAYFSGVSFQDAANVFFVAKNPQQYDAAISATIKLMEIVNDARHASDARRTGRSGF